MEILWKTTWDSVFRGGRRDLKNLAFGVLEGVLSCKLNIGYLEISVFDTKMTDI